MKFSQDLQETMKYLNNELHTDRNFDVVYRVLTIGGKMPVSILSTALQG